MSAYNPNAHLEAAERELERADAIANQDGSMPDRQERVANQLARAQVEATLAVSERLDCLIGLIFDEGRAITVVGDTSGRI